MEQTLQQQIKELKQELSTRKEQVGWVIDSLKQELKRLEKKNDRQTSSSNKR